MLASVGPTDVTLLYAGIGCLGGGILLTLLFACCCGHDVNYVEEEVCVTNIGMVPQPVMMMQQPVSGAKLEFNIRI